MVDDIDFGDVASFPQPTMRILTEQARERLSKFYKPALDRHKQKMSNIQLMPMSPASEEILYQTLQIDTEALLVEQARKELEHGILLDPGVPCSLGYGSDPD